MSGSLDRARAFTLVEVLVALGITVVLAGLMLSIVTNTAGLWGRTADALELDDRARLVLDRLATDLESAFVRQDGKLWLEPGAATADDGMVLRLFANLAATGSDPHDPATLREVRYELRQGGQLFRFEGTAAAAWQNNYTFAEPAPVSDGEFLLAPNVAGLTVAFHADTDGPALASLDALHWPRLARISLTLMTPSGSARLDAVRSGRSDEDEARIRDETAREFVRWVAIEGRPW